MAAYILCVVLGWIISEIFTKVLRKSAYRSGYDTEYHAGCQSQGYYDGASLSRNVEMLNKSHCVKSYPNGSVFACTVDHDHDGPCPMELIVPVSTHE